MNSRKEPFSSTSPSENARGLRCCGLGFSDDKFPLPQQGPRWASRCVGTSLSSKESSNCACLLLPNVA